MFVFVRAATLGVFLTILAVVNSFAQLVHYQVSWEETNSHYFHVEMRFENPEPGPVSVRIPSWRPGRYIVQDYAKNIVAFRASDDSGADLRFRKTDKATWEIDAAPGQSVTVNYLAYSRQMDAGSSYLDETEAYINPVTMLMYLPGHELEPVTFSVQRPDDWMSATALSYSSEMDGYWAADYHELADSPFIISPTLEIHSFQHGGTTFEVAIQGDASLDRERFVSDVRKIVEVQTSIMGVIPFDRYVFLYHFLPHQFGHGVEHKNSTSIVIGPAEFDKPGMYRRLLGITSHEFWHTWLVERIRPEAIYLPDYSEEAYTSTLWVYEGITSYYGALTLRRAGLITEEAYEAQIAGTIGSFKDDPGREFTSVAMSSWDVWTKSRGAPPHSYSSFYTAGSVLGLLLDLEVRGRTRNRQSLDDVMRYLYQNYAARDVGVPEDGLQTALETVTSGTFAPFFDDHVYGSKPIDYNRYLFFVGYALEQATDPAKPEVKFGVDASPTGGSVKIARLRPDGSAFRAGLAMDDEILALDGQRVTTSNLTDLLMGLSPGDTTTVTVFRRDHLRMFDVVLDGGGNTRYELRRLPDTTLLQNQTRRDWLNLAAG
jgi:predicted metalloprotease with PDZ domain